MRNFAVASIVAVSLAEAMIDIPTPSMDSIGSSSLDMFTGQSEIMQNESSVIDYNHPTATKKEGSWLDEQELTLDVFEEVVTTDTENVWVIAYVDPREPESLTLSLEWEKLTQIEEKEKRKVKLGYVDVSVVENWKIIQDHTKGKQLTTTPAVTLYGENKEAPHWYEPKQPTADSVHTWVTDYADHHGYGYWDPDYYTGASVKPHDPRLQYAGNGRYAQDPQYGHHQKDPSKPAQERYGIKQRHYYDSKRHNGALAKAGVAVGKDGKGYRLGGNWKKGDQVVQLKTNKDGLVMRRRTVTQGGKLGGVAHRIPEKYLHADHRHVGQQGQYGHQGYPNQHGSYGSHQAHHGNQYGAVHNKHHGQYQTGYAPQYGRSTTPGAYGTYGNPNKKYYGQGAEHLQKNLAAYETRWHPTKGQGIVLGKYTNTKVTTNENTNFDQKGYMLDKDSEMYKDAMQLAIDSGFGQSEIVWGDDFQGMYDDIILEDVPDISAALNIEHMEIEHPEHGLLDHKFEEIAPPTAVEAFAVPDMLDNHVESNAVPDIIDNSHAAILPEGHVPEKKAAPELDFEIPSISQVGAQGSLNNAFLDDILDKDSSSKSSFASATKVELADVADLKSQLAEYPSSSPQQPKASQPSEVYYNAPGAPEHEPFTPYNEPSQIPPSQKIHAPLPVIHEEAGFYPNNDSAPYADTHGSFGGYEENYAGDYNNHQEPLNNFNHNHDEPRYDEPLYNEPIQHHPEQPSFDFGYDSAPQGSYHEPVDVFGGRDPWAEHETHQVSNQEIEHFDADIHGSHGLFIQNSNDEQVLPPNAGNQEQADDFAYLSESDPFASQDEFGGAPVFDVPVTNSPVDFDFYAPTENDLVLADAHNAEDQQDIDNLFANGQLESFTPPAEENFDFGPSDYQESPAFPTIENHSHPDESIWGFDDSSAGTDSVADFPVFDTLSGDSHSAGAYDD